MIEMIHAPRHPSGGGLPGVEVVPDSLGRMVGPFALLASVGPAYLPKGLPQDADVRPHPHIGMGVLAYLKSGEITHRDDLGNVHRHRAGEATWMLCGRGIVHSERLETLRQTGGEVQALVAFVALPEDAEEALPAWYHLPQDSLPLIYRRGAEGRLLLGTAAGLSSPAPLSSPAYLIDWTVQRGAHFAPQAHASERAVLIVSGSLAQGDRSFGPGEMLTLTPGAGGTLRAPEGAELIEFGGEPVGPRYRWWNFLSSRLERIEAAKQGWLSPGRSLPPGEAEYIPLPTDHERPLQLLSPGASLTPATQTGEAA